MRVLIDTTYAERAPFSGTGVYIRRLLDELGGIDGVEPLAAANPHRRPAAGGGLGSVRNVADDLWWSGATLPRLARTRRAEVIHHTLPAHAPRAGLPQVITVADLAFEVLPACFDRGFRTYAHHVHRAAARASQAVICVSETTAADVRSYWGVAPERIAVALHGPGQELLAAGEPAEPPRHLLYVGDDEPRKDLRTLLDAYARYRGATSAPLPLLIAGSVRADQPGVDTVPHPDPGRLAELYRDAAALVHPSLHEGFGLTPVEAMSLGTPVVAARSPGTIEICADAVAYAPGGDAAALAETIGRLAADPALRADLRARGRERVTHFSWSKCAREHVDAYSLALRQ